MVVQERYTVLDMLCELKRGVARIVKLKRQKYGGICASCQWVINTEALSAERAEV